MVSPYVIYYNLVKTRHAGAPVAQGEDSMKRWRLLKFPAISTCAKGSTERNSWRLCEHLNLYLSLEGVVDVCPSKKVLAWCDPYNRALDV